MTTVYILMMLESGKEREGEGRERGREREREGGREEGRERERKLIATCRHLCITTLTTNLNKATG